jgi:hypothetical protein
MSESPKVPPEEFAETMRAETEQYLKQIMEAVNLAPDGAWIPVSQRGRNQNAPSVLPEPQELAAHVARQAHRRCAATGPQRDPVPVAQAVHSSQLDTRAVSF